MLMNGGDNPPTDDCIDPSEILDPTVSPISLTPSELEAIKAAVWRGNFDRHPDLLREIEAKRWHDVKMPLSPLLDRMWADRRDEKDFMLAARLALNASQKQISKELEISLADIAVRVDRLRKRYNPEFKDILGTGIS